MLLSFCFCSFDIEAQVSNSIVVRGSVYDKNDSSASPSAIILNKRTGTGQISNSSGVFSIAGIKADTFLVTAGGYEVKSICFQDSTAKEIYSIRIGLQIKSTLLNSVSIYPVKDLDEIKRERAAIGKEQTRQTLGVVDAVASPITYLYERFSREGRSKEAVAILENNDRKRAILKELFRTYNRAGVMVLEEEEFDAFISYLNLSESFLRSASDYNLAVYIRQRYLSYRAAQKMHNRNQR